MKFGGFPTKYTPSKVPQLGNNGNCLGYFHQKNHTTSNLPGEIGDISPATVEEHILHYIIIIRYHFCC